MEVKQMNRREIHFEIDRDGNITSTIQGIKGSLCETVATEFKSLGKVTEQNPTNEFYEPGDRQRVVLCLEQKD
jgi:hypothetical protein